ncbi:hypothetical protein [Rheinheimera sp. EpRS3]|uniref:hypothetical protein n=1 Tax=Rheinheimera sp. EpRS3 TaxID=1712383 RepID=UPI0007482881|nr:hypothetical protein [Rheinheimera sp. EpRS3]KUM52787.1 hypothetical protein AR688_10990 [Rheinheimera sp. EpRS3]
MDEELVTFDLATDLHISLNCLSDVLKQAISNEHKYLKWAIIYSHNSVQSAMCLALTTSDSRLTRKRDSYDRDYGELDNIEWLYEKLLNPDILPYMGSKTIDPALFNKAIVSRLQTVRNKFIHQQPITYVFTKTELIGLIDFSVSILDFLISHSERTALGPAKEAIVTLIDKIKEQLISYCTGKVTRWRLSFSGE